MRVGPDCKCRKANAGLRNKVESDIIYPRLGCLIFTYFRVLVRAVEGGLVLLIGQKVGVYNLMSCALKSIFMCGLTF